MRILAPLLRFDYGDPLRGESLERKYFVPALAEHAEVISFWLEDNGFLSDIDLLQTRILEEAERLDPDLIFFILMKDEVRKETIECLSRRWKTINWFADDQWRFDSFTKFVAPLFTYAVTVDKFSLRRYRSIGYRNVILSQWGSSYEAFCERPSEFTYDVTFVGGYNDVRKWYIDELERAGIRVECFGSGWPNGRVSFDEIKRIFRSSKVSLNLTNSATTLGSYYLSLWRKLLRAAIHAGGEPKEYLRTIKRAVKAILRFHKIEKRREQIKARNFEIPAWGGFQVSHYPPGIEDYFVLGKEIIVYKSIRKLKQSVRYYLEHEDERESIRIAGNRRAASYTYSNRIKEVLEYIR